MTPIENPLQSFFYRHWRGLLLLALPLLITLINPNWLYNPHALNKIDTWIYQSLFRYYPDFATAPHLASFYFPERLSWILPGYILYHLFSPEIANALLHLGVYYLAVFSIYGIARRLFGVDAAFLMALCLSGYTWFLRAVGHDYLDGAGIAYYSASLWLITQAIYERRYKLYLVAAGALLTLTIVTQLSWAAFMLFIGIYFLALNRKQNRHPLVTSLAWVSLGIIGVMSVFLLVNVSVTGEWNIFKNSVMFLRAVGKNADATRDAAWVAYSSIPRMWLVLPCVISLWGAVSLSRSKQLSDNLRYHLILITSGFALTWVIFLFLHFTSSLPYLMIYLYISISTPIMFLLGAGLLTISNIKILTFYEALLMVGIVILPFLLVVLFQPLEEVTLNPLIVWPMIVIALGMMFRRHPSWLVGGFTLMSFMLGGGNGIAYHDRLQTYNIFVGVNETIEAIHNHPTLDDAGELMVWYETTTFRPYASSVFNSYWGGTNWVVVQNAPQDLRLTTDVTEDVVILTDNDAILDKVQSVLDGRFDVELVTDFPILSVDPSGQYRGYILRLSRLDYYNQPIFPTGENIRKSRMDYTEFVPAVTGPDSQVVLEFRLPSPTSDLEAVLCVEKMLVPFSDGFSAMLNGVLIEFALADSAENSVCEFTFIADVPQDAIDGENLTTMAMNIPVGKVGSSYEGFHIAFITFTTKNP